MAQFRRGRSLDTEQDRTEGSVKSEFLPPMFEIVGNSASWSSAF